MIANLVFASRTPSQTRAAFLIDDHCRKDRAKREQAYSALRADA